MAWEQEFVEVAEIEHSRVLESDKYMDSQLPRQRKPEALVSQAGKRKAVLFAAKLALSGTSLVIVFLIAEAALRLGGAKPQTATALTSYFQFSSQTGWTGRPNAASRFCTANFDVFITHTADGLRRCGLDRTIDEDDGSESEVVWCMGDSGTWGWGVGHGESYVERLNSTTDNSRIYRNLGMCGFSSIQQYFLLKENLELDRIPDQVVLLFCDNDLGENLDKKDQDPPRPYLEEVGGRFEIQNYPTPVSRRWNMRKWLKNKSLAYNHLNFHIMCAKKAFNDRRKQRVSMRNAEFVATEDSPERLFQYRALKTVYGMIDELCDQYNVRFAVAAWHPDELATVSRVCGELNVQVLDISRLFQRHYQSSKEPAPIRFRTDPHLNALGHQFLAEGIHHELERLHMALSGEHDGVKQ